MSKEPSYKDLRKKISVLKKKYFKPLKDMTKKDMMDLIQKLDKEHDYRKVKGDKVVRKRKVKPDKPKPKSIVKKTFDKPKLPKRRKKTRLSKLPPQGRKGVKNLSTEAKKRGIKVTKPNKTRKRKKQLLMEILGAKEDNYYQT